MFITGLGTATPSRHYSQRECWDFAKSTELIRKLAPRSQALLRKVLLGDNGIEARYLAMDSLEEIFHTDPDELHRRFSRHAPKLASCAAARALEAAGLSSIDMDALIISTCTGYLCPGLTSYVSEQLGLRSDALLLDLVGQGCGAAVPNLRTAEALLASGRAHQVLSVCVEVCSAAFYLDDDPGVLVSACLFGDGAAAAVLSEQPNLRGRQVGWKGAWTRLSAADRDCLRFEQRGGLLRNVLTREVPQLAGNQVEALLTDTLKRSHLQRDGVAAWIMHSGGRTVLEAVGERLGLTQKDLRWSAGVLREGTAT